MNLREIKHILEASDLRLTKSLGQNFLHDQNQLRRIVAAAELKSGDSVIEVGPGLGALTQHLLGQSVEVLAIEKDHRLFVHLAEQYRSSPQLSLVHADALDYLRRERRDWTGWKLVANLPYSVASSILVEFARMEQSPERLATTLQLEVGQRLMAEPGTKDYGVLTLLIQLRYQPAEWFKVPASCFYPIPKVDSACVTLVRREATLLSRNEEATFERIVKRGFSQRRKMMLKLLKHDWPAPVLADAFAQIKLAPEIRAERVSLDRFVDLSRLLAPVLRPGLPTESTPVEKDPCDEHLQIDQDDESDGRRNL